MIIPEILPIILVIVVGLVFFIIDEYHDYLKIHNSLLAGIALAYFFLVVLPEISDRLPVYPLHLRTFEYFFVLLGFATIHVVEKLIFQKAEKSTKERARKLVKMENMLEMVEHNLSLNITEELHQNLIQDVSIDALKELADTIYALEDKSSEMKAEISRLEEKIEQKVNEEIDQVRWISSFIYHFFIGLLLYGVFLVNILDGILFSLFALFMGLISIRYQQEMVMSDLNIIIEYHVSPRKKLLSGISVLAGGVVSIILALFIPLNLEVLYLLFSFIAGLILYPIVRDVIPENESGKPVYFLLGMALFSLFIYVVKYLQHEV